MINAVYYVIGGYRGFTYGPIYDLIEARQLAEEVEGWVEDENGLKVVFT